MAGHSYDVCAYEERYWRVYEAGAEFWEESKPTEALVKFLSEHGSFEATRVIDSGCGEGRDLKFS
jgi:hypothetical protein